MKLEITTVIQAPLDQQNISVWVAENRGVFIISDRWKVATLHSDGTLETIWKTADNDEAYSMKGLCDERLPEDLYNEILETGFYGFRFLKSSIYTQINYSAGSTSSMEIVNQFGPIDQAFPLDARDNAIIIFGRKTISMSYLTEEGLLPLKTVKTKGKLPVCVALYPQNQIIMYATNNGELYGQLFCPGCFGETIKVDRLPSTCSQISFSPDGSKLFVCGVGYLRMYRYADGELFRLAITLQIPAKSFELIEDLVVVNKGLHGIDVWKITDSAERIFSMEVPFAVNRMTYMASRQTFLMSSKDSKDLYLLECSA